MSPRGHRSSQLYPQHRDDLILRMRAAWRAVCGGMSVVQIGSDDYRALSAVAEALYDGCIALDPTETWRFSATIREDGRRERASLSDDEVDAMIAACGADARVAVRTLMLATGRTSVENPIVFVAVSGARISEDDSGTTAE